MIVRTPKVFRYKARGGGPVYWGSVLPLENAFGATYVITTYEGRVIAYANDIPERAEYLIGPEAAKTIEWFDCVPSPKEPKV